ncbi:CGNR zinc finger domain-containing protein [Streptomyces sp. 6N223]|uniref:CGNR zinc finger domain-containing protein n=1 Tax=Streptomyces sp. 6N223 TaxID=3457412 RepID=UPI003FD1F239
MGDRSTPSGLVLVEALINTWDIEADEDELATPRGRADFSRRHGLPEFPNSAVPELQRLREALRAACLAHAGVDIPADEMPAPLPAPLTLRLSPTGAAALDPAPGLPPVAALTARVAAAVAAAQADGTWQRLKACESHTCRWAYYDHSPAGRRRWCSMQVCGARAKMRAYRARRNANPA